MLRSPIVIRNDLLPTLGKRSTVRKDSLKSRADPVKSSPLISLPLDISVHARRFAQQNLQRHVNRILHPTIHLSA